METYPGTERHQRALRAIAAYYRDNPRVLAVVLFGSLARGDWDVYSDLDLDVVLGEGVVVDAYEECAALCRALAAAGDQIAAIVRHGDDSTDALFPSTLQLSVRYHALATTSPNILDSMVLLCGHIGLEAIRAAGLAQIQPTAWNPQELVGQCLRCLLEADVALRRGRLWFAVVMLGRVRDTLIELYGRARRAARPLHFFQAEAESEIQQKVAALLARLDEHEVRAAIVVGGRLLESDLPRIACGQVTLTAEQRALLSAILDSQ